MSNITIIDEDYKSWLQELSQRYRRSQIKAAVRVNSEMLRYYWSLGRDIVMLKAESRWGDKFMQNLSRDMKALLPEAKCFSETNLLYMKNFYRLYRSIAPQLDEQFDKRTEITPQPGEQFAITITPQVVEQMSNTITPQVVEQIPQHVVEQYGMDIFSIPWGHYRYLLREEVIRIQNNARMQ